MSSYDPKKTEEKWYAFWQEKGFFKADAHSSKEPFTLVIPPPNVTGVLHMGHALVNTLQDILIRWKRMEGFEALWVPGTDHAGISTQIVVEKDLYVKTGKRRKDFTREEFLEAVWAWKEKSEGQILGQLKKLGCSCDWSRQRFTMDGSCNRAVLAAFKKMFDEGHIYRGDYLVNWDPITQTALSDDEVEHEERASFLWYIRYPVEKGHITLATTRPETLLGDTAIAVHPDDPRYRSLIGKKARLPLTSREIPILADPFVDPTFGTGAVKITPAHDFNDFEMGQRHNLPRINILTPDGKINENGGPFAGLSWEEARIQVVHALQKQNLLEKVEPYTLRVGLSYRSKAIVQPYLSKQWFIRMAPFKEKLISAVKEKRVTLIPPHWEATYFHWIENLRDWCISRQLWWGHRIPIWYGPKGEIVCPDENTLPPAGWTQDPDVLDTWFSSSLWPLSVLGWPDKNAPDFKKFYPTSTLVTGHDILFFWVARMILMGEYLGGNVPFHETFLHGLIYGKSYWRTGPDGSPLYLSGDEKKKYDLGAPLPSDIESKWEKMSKTKGNVIDPLEIIDTYGCDAMRIALASSTTYARQIDLDQRRFEEFKNFANKVWNGARFVFMNIETLTPEELSQEIEADKLEDKWILSVLNRTTLEINNHLASYAFDKAATRTYEFFWNDFCATYVELSKPVLFGKMGTPAERTNKQRILVHLLLNSILLLHPITPFITEELYQMLRQKFPTFLPSLTITLTPFPKPSGSPDTAIEEDFALLGTLVRSIRNIRTEMQIPPGEKTDLYLHGPQESREWKLAHEHQNILLSLTPTQTIHFQKPTAFGSTAALGPLKLFIPIPESLKAKEKVRLEKEKEKLEKLALSTSEKLANPDFRAKAPAEVVTKLEQTLLQTQQQLKEISQRLF